MENARRGSILDARGETLATSRPLIDVGLDPRALRPEDEARWPELARLLGISVAAIRAAARSSDDPLEDDERAAKPVQWVKLAEGVDESVYEGDKTGRNGIKDLKIRGVYGSRVYRRDYPHNEMAAHIIGYVDRDRSARSREWSITRISTCAGRTAGSSRRRTARARSSPSSERARFPPIDGYNVVAVDRRHRAAHGRGRSWQRSRDEYDAAEGDDHRQRPADGLHPRASRTTRRST